MRKSVALPWARRTQPQAHDELGRDRACAIYLSPEKERTAVSGEAMTATKEKTQRQKFEEALREHGADDSDDVFESAVRKVAKAPKLSDEEIKRRAKEHRDRR
jgi:formiminotetrahydrofolate cyclodeaminase